MQPAYWLVRKDILDARARLSFSTIGSQPEAAQKAALYESVATMQLGANPQKHTISVLFADPKRTKAGTTPGTGSSAKALVTWTERDDPHWFGARMADRVISVEIDRPSANDGIELSRGRVHDIVGN